MDEPKRSLHDIITIKNIDSQDFTFEYGRAEGNYPYTIKAGAIARFPRFLARHAMKHLIDQILNRRNLKTSNEAAREELQQLIFVEEEVFQQGPGESESDKQRREVERLNQPSDLEAVLTRNRGKTRSANPSGVVIGAKGVEPRKEEPKEEPKPEKEFAGLSDREAKRQGYVGGEVDTTVKDEPPPASPKPTKAELIAWAGKQGLELDSKDSTGSTLRLKLERMKVDDIIKEIDYPV